MPYQTKIITLRQALQDYAAPWQTLIEQESIEPTQLPGWLQITCSVFKTTDKTEVCLIFNDQQELVSVIPYTKAVSKNYGLHVITVEIITNLISYHSIILGIKASPENFQLFLNSIGRWDICTAPTLLTQDHSYQQLKQVITKQHWIQTILTLSSPYIEITSSWEDFLAQRSRSFRYRLKRKAKAVAKAGTMNIKWYTDNTDLDELHKSMLSIESNSWKINADMAITQSAVEQDYYKRLLPWMADNHLLMANVMFIDDTPVAYGLHYNFKQRWGQLKTSFDNRYQEYSPGKHLVDITIERAFKTGVREFDFLGDKMPHKLEWTDLARQHETLYVYNSNSLKGKLTGLIKHCISEIKSLKHKFSESA